MNYNLIRLLPLAVVLAVLTACPAEISDPIAILTPVEDSSVGTTAFKAEISTPIDPASIKVTINDKLVPAGEYTVTTSASPGSKTVVAGTLGLTHVLVGSNMLGVGDTVHRRAQLADRRRVLDAADHQQLRADGVELAPHRGAELDHRRRLVL